MVNALTSAKRDELKVKVREGRDFCKGSPAFEGSSELKRINLRKRVLKAEGLFFLAMPHEGEKNNSFQECFDLFWLDRL